jgi:catalase
MHDKNAKDPSAELNTTDKSRELDADRTDIQGKQFSTEQGVKVPTTDDSLRAGERGPTLLEDFHFREKITHLDHERIPERVVHARGSGAHGYFQVYEPLTDLTRAKFLQDPSKKTPVFVRFSTVVGSRGSADTVRDVRGFATKFYTDEGIFDLVGNNIPVFFIQDGIKFPDLVHAVKPEPHHEMPQGASAHDTFWDFVTLTPESTHMLLWVLSDRALPRSYRMMEGFGVHTFRLINESGKSRFVKFHWKPILGVHSMVWDEMQKIAGKDPDFHRRDLWEAIDTGAFPEYELGLQIIEEDDEFAFDFDLLDATKIVPEELVPVRRVGKLTLTQNTDNFFAETEQVAFCPANVVPGIDITNDPLLQARLFSYLDTQLSRLGGPNFMQIPINRPLAPVHNHNQDGFMQQAVRKGRVNYSPNSLAGNSPAVVSERAGGYAHYPQPVKGTKTRDRAESFRDHYTQATLFWNSMSEPEKEHIVKAAQFELGKVETKAIRQRAVEQFARVDRELATRIAAGLGLPAPSVLTTAAKAAADAVGTVKDAVAGRRSVDRSPSLSIENTPRTSIKTRKVAILAAHGVSGAEVQAVKAALLSQGAIPEVVSIDLGTLRTADGQGVEVDKTFLTAGGSVIYDAVFVPGGAASVAALSKEGDALAFVNEAFRHAKPIGASAEGVDLLVGSSIKGVTYAGPGAAGSGTGNSSAVVSDKGVVTVRDASDLGAFNGELVRAIMQHRHWNRELKEQVPA